MIRNKFLLLNFYRQGEKMSKTLVLAEKPSVGRDLAKVLKCNQNKGSYIEGSKYIVTWAMGI